MKYPIKREFFPFSVFIPPINFFTLKLANLVLSHKLWLHSDNDISVRKEKLGESGAEVFLLEPKTAGANSPCLIYIHGGGFVMEAAPSHFALAKIYAKELSCKVAFVRYRLAPKHPFPAAPEDCFSALEWVIANADRLGIDKNKIGVGGDSAGGALSAAISLMARDRLSLKLRFQMLIYPVTDYRMSTQSNKLYTDTPMWNSALSNKMWQMYLPDKTAENIEYASPAEAQSLDDLPPAYIETAQFDCLRDEALEYAGRLRACGIQTETVQTSGTMHGFDVMYNSPTARECITKRVQFMKEHFSEV